MKTTVRQYRPTDEAEWLRMRRALWPESDNETHRVEVAVWLVRSDVVVLVAVRLNGEGLAGFAEVGTRSVADGCETSPVAYLEGWYVDSDVRRQGVGAALLQAAEGWARGRGLREFASDAEISNVDSQNAHLALGFRETEKVVLYFKKL